MKRISLFLILLFLMLTTSVLAQSLYQDVVKPVDVKDYDFSYEGISGTGSVGYSTLYRDNYFFTIAGEFCDTGEESINVFNKIVASFKFVDDIDIPDVDYYFDSVEN